MTKRGAIDLKFNLFFQNKICYTNPTNILSNALVLVYVVGF